MSPYRLPNIVPGVKNDPKLPYQLYTRGYTEHEQFQVSITAVSGWHCGVYNSKKLPCQILEDMPATSIFGNVGMTSHYLISLIVKGLLVSEHITLVLLTFSVHVYSECSVFSSQN